MSVRLAACLAVALSALALAGCAAPSATTLEANAAASPYGVVAVRSVHPFAETVARLKADIADKGLVFFQEIDQRKLAADAGIDTQPSTLLVFGNPALGTQFITANPQAGIDWPVRLLVYRDQAGQVWAEYTDFAYVAQRHAITSRDAQFTKASEVIASIASRVQQ
jgi:uncharacterized protein (DUF302 family)